MHLARRLISPFYLPVNIYFIYSQCNNQTLKLTNMKKTFNQEQKDHWIKVGEDHRKHDRIVQGQWLREKDETGVYRGCFFGCYLQTEYNVLLTASQEMHLPEWLVRVSEKIFEGLNAKKAVDFPVNLLNAIPVDADLHEVWKKWNYTLLMDEKRGQITFCKDIEVCNKAVKDVANLFLSDSIDAKAATEVEWATEIAGSLSVAEEENHYEWMAETLIKLLQEHKS